MQPREKQHKDFSAVTLPDKRCPAKKMGITGECMPICDDFLQVNKTGVSQPALLTSHKGDETPAGTECSSV